MTRYHKRSAFGLDDELAWPQRGRRPLGILPEVLQENYMKELADASALQRFRLGLDLSAVVEVIE